MKQLLFLIGTILYSAQALSIPQEYMKVLSCLLLYSNISNSWSLRQQSKS